MNGAAGASYLNTSHVNLQRLAKIRTLSFRNNLNTSHVNLQLTLDIDTHCLCYHLNTSHVNLQQGHLPIHFRVITFKYISC